MQPTPEQKQAFHSGAPVPVVVDHTECVVIRRDTYMKTCELLVEEAYPTVLNAWDASGSPHDGHLHKQ